MPHNLVFSLQGNIGGQICVFNHQSGSGTPDIAVSYSCSVQHNPGLTKHLKRCSGLVNLVQKYKLLKIKNGHPTSYVKFYLEQVCFLAFFI